MPAIPDLTSRTRSMESQMIVSPLRRRGARATCIPARDAAEVEASAFGPLLLALVMALAFAMLHLLYGL
jgi:hypothetical protein